MSTTILTTITIVTLLFSTVTPEYKPMYVGTIYACAPVFIRTEPSMQSPVVVLETAEYATVNPGDVVTYYLHSSKWVHLSSGIGFLPAQAVNDDTCFVDVLPPWLVCLQQYAASVPSANPEASRIVAAYAYYSRHYNVDPFFVLAQAFHESNVLRSPWATLYFNYAGLWVSGEKRTVKPLYGYWVPSGSVWIAGRSFATITEGVSEHVRIVARYGSEERVLTRWAVDPQYATKVRSWHALLYRQCADVTR